jgi:hypothetical protein
MIDSPFELGPVDRGLVLAAIRDVCIFRGWELLAAHVRTNHVHAVVQGTGTPEIMMFDVQSLCKPHARVWAKAVGAAWEHQVFVVGR